MEKTADSRNYRIADIDFTFTAQYPFLTKQCHEYETEEPGIDVSVTEAEIEKEKMTETTVSPGYLESLAVYRKISEIMPEHDTFLFHCSAIAVDDQGYLFTAPSGTGKSTHTRLWRERFDGRAVMINDDKPMIQVRDDEIYVCGTPWNGKHNLGCNRKVPIRGICILERGTKNSIWQMKSAEAYPFLWVQIYHPANRESMIRTIQLLKKVAERIPLYRLQCNISQEAVTVAWDAMSRTQEG